MRDGNVKVQSPISNLQSPIPNPQSPIPTGDVALRAAAAALHAGQIVAVKGLGGFHLMADARNAKTVAELRRRKRRVEKPFALMARDLAQIRALCDVPSEAETLLTSPEAPIVLLRRRTEDGRRGEGEKGRKGEGETTDDERQTTDHERRTTAGIAGDVAPGNPYLGVMLPATPLHHLLMGELDFPIVATSGNVSDEPICIDEHEALERLGGIADSFLVHDRPIARHVDDSVAMIMAGAPQLLRRARGYAPLPVLLKREAPCILGVGAHLKNTVALSVGRQVFISQHIGDMETPQAITAFERVINDFLQLYEATPISIAHDLHPDYTSTRFAVQMEQQQSPISNPQSLIRIPVQHHHAHFAACLAENGEDGPALGVIWDGTGYGLDGAIWGGEFLLGNLADSQRIAHMRPFRLPGGDAAVREPRRVALALLWELYGPAAIERDDLPPAHMFSESERRVLAQMLDRGVNAPLTTSAGRLFDGIAALAGLHQRVNFEGQAAMALEFAADLFVSESYPVGVTSDEGRRTEDGGWRTKDGQGDGEIVRQEGEGAGRRGDETQYATHTTTDDGRRTTDDGRRTTDDGRRTMDDGRRIIDWRPTVEAALADVRAGVGLGVIAARFHNTMVDVIVDIARATGESRVALSGGCFQNRLLTERAVQRLRELGFTVLLHRQVPPNDGGISLGQVATAAARLERRRG
jgi:hydrogenase maturation protein HypF